MNIRKNARWLTEDERNAFLKAVLTLKARKHTKQGATMSTYDFFPLEHRIVRRRRKQSDISESLGDGGHGEAAFLPWHREWLRRFELDLRSVDPSVTIPYWDWTDKIGSKEVLFQDNFMGPNGTGPNFEIQSGYFQETVPEVDRPFWWPVVAGTPLSGFKVIQSISLLERRMVDQGAGFNTTALTRSFGISDFSNPWNDMLSKNDIKILLDTAEYVDFRFEVEGGDFHGWGHGWGGGLMGRPPTSPNDPMFWLHHATVDQMWAHWQKTHPQNKPEHLPPSRTTQPLRYGHNLEDYMWPWDGTLTINPNKAQPPAPRVSPPPGNQPAPVFPNNTFLRDIDPTDTVKSQDLLNHHNLPDGTGYMYDTEIPLKFEKNNQPLAWIEPLFGDLNLVGVLHSNSTGSPNASDFVYEVNGQPKAWFDVRNGDLYLKGRIEQEELDFSVNVIQDAFKFEHYNQPLAYIKSNGNFHIKGSLKINQALPQDF